MPDATPQSVKPPLGHAPADPGEPVFIRRVVIALAIVSAFVAVFLLLAYAPDALILTFAAAWFGCVLHFAALWVSRWTGLSEHWAMGAVVTLLLALTIGFLVLLGWQIAGRIDELVGNLEESIDSLWKQVESQSPQLKTLIRRTPPERAAQVVFGGQAGSSVSELLATPFGLLVNVLYIFFTGLYLATSPRMYRDGFVALFPVHRRAKLRHVCDEAGELLWKWTLARLASMAIVGTLAGTGLVLLGVPMAATLGILTFLFEFIPNIGPVVSAIPPLLLSFSLGGSTPLYVFLLYVGIQAIESYLLTPLIHQHEDNLPAAVVIAVQLLFGILFGLIGIAFAMPMTLVVMLFLQRFYIERGLEGTNVEREIGAHS